MKMALRITGQMTGWWQRANRSCHDAPPPEVTITPCALTFFIELHRGYSHHVLSNVTRYTKIRTLHNRAQ